MNEDRKPGPAYSVRTRRCLIRCWEPGDAPRLRVLIDGSFEQLRPYIPWMHAEPASLEQTCQRLRDYRAAFDRDENYRYGVFSPDGETLIGETGLYRRLGPDVMEIGYWTGVQFAGQGYASETSAAMLWVAFVLEGVQRVEIHCAADNQASARIPEKLGFQKEATLARRSRDPDGVEHDLQIWTLFREDWTTADDAEVQAFDCLGRSL